MSSPLLEDAVALLNALVEDEENPIRPILFLDIKAACLDKLLEDITNPYYHLPDHPPLTFRETIAKAQYIQKMWRSRFRHDYFTIDVTRCHELRKTSLQRDIVFNTPGENPGWYGDTRRESADFGL